MESFCKNPSRSYSKAEHTPTWIRTSELVQQSYSEQEMYAGFFITIRKWTKRHKIYKNSLILIFISTRLKIFLMNTNTNTEDVDKLFEFVDDFWFNR